MKLNNIVLPLVLALTATLATTGCRHGFSGKVTTLPGHRAPTPVDTGANQNTLPPGNPVNPGDNAGANANGQNNPFGGPGAVGNIPTSTDWQPGDMNQDRDKLAADTVHFKFDSAVVQDNEQVNVANVGQALSADPTAKLLIEGHCDERGTEQYNLSLGERRALALRESLAKDGIDPMRIRTISYGKDKPVDQGHDEEAWAKNRRGEFIYCTPKTPVQ
jgi:peptidoglycan-associated lipoprotein